MKVQKLLAPAHPLYAEQFSRSSARQPGAMEDGESGSVRFAQIPRLKRPFTALSVLGVAAS